MNILITGGAGFIGSHLADHLLLSGCTVHVLDSFYSNYDRKQKQRNVLSNLTKSTYYLHEGDIRVRKTLEELFLHHTIDVVVHLAALPGVQTSFKQASEYHEINVMGTRNVLDAMRKFGIQKIVYGSSSSVYGERCLLPMKESDLGLRPISPYAMTKLEAEQLCRLYHNRYGIEASCLRFFTVYGPRQRPDMAMSKFLTTLVQQLPLTIYGENTSRDFTYVSDIVQGIYKAIFSIQGFEIYNIGSGIQVSVQHLIDTLEIVTGQKATVVHKPGREGDVSHTWADLTKARQRLNYQPAVNLTKGLEQLVSYLIPTIADNKAVSS